MEDANHGKLLWDESDHLDGYGYATSTGERVIFIMDMNLHETVGTFDYTEFVKPLKHPNYCMGTHAIAYSSKNNHLYLECVGGGGILEIDVNDPANPVFVAKHSQSTGALYEIPDGSAVIASDKGGNQLHVFLPNGPGKESSTEVRVNVPGNPSTPSFYPMKDGSSYIACMPLTENTNTKHRKDGQVVCDINGCSGAMNSDDVAHGICAYDPSNPRNLLEVSLNEKENVLAEEAPYNGACIRCESDGNYDENGKCVCTPFCGSCGEPTYDASISGVQCVNLEEVFSSNSSVEATLIEGAGAVEQAGPQSYSPTCGFGRTYRAHKR